MHCACFDHLRSSDNTTPRCRWLSVTVTACPSIVGVRASSMISLLVDKILVFAWPNLPCQDSAHSSVQSKNVRSGSVRLLSRRSNARNVNLLSSCVLWHGVVLSLCFFTCDRTCGKHLLHSSICTVAPRMRVTGGSFAICVSFSIKPKRKNERKNARSQSARLLCERIATVRVFRFSLFFFFWRPSRKLVVANAKS